MESSPEEMISRVLEELGLAAEEGISISQVFNENVTHISSNLSTVSAGDSIKDQLWQLLIVRDDVIIGDDTWGPTLKKLTFNEVLLLGLGERKVKIRKIPAPRNDSPGEASPNPQSTPQSAAQTGDIQSEGTMESSIEVQIPQSLASSALAPPSASDPDEATIDPRAILDPSASTPQPEIESLQPPSTPSSQAIAKKAGAAGTDKKTPQRKTDRRWTFKPIFTPQEQVEREEEEAKLEKGIPGVYSNLFDRKRPVDHAGGRRKEQRILVFKSDQLMDPQWLQMRRGTWVERYRERKFEHDAWVKEQAEQIEPTPRKRRPSEVSVPSSVNIDDQPPKKRRRRGKSATSAGSPGPEMTSTALPITLVAARFGARQLGTYVSPWSSQSTPAPQVAHDLISSSQQAAISNQEYHSPFPLQQSSDHESKYLSPSTPQSVAISQSFDSPALTPQEAAQQHLSRRGILNQTIDPQSNNSQHSYLSPQATQSLHPAIGHGNVLQQGDTFQNSASPFPQEPLNPLSTPANTPQHATTLTLSTKRPQPEFGEHSSSQYRAHEDTISKPSLDPSLLPPSLGVTSTQSRAYNSPYWMIDTGVSSTTPTSASQGQSNVMTINYPAESQTHSNPESAPISSSEQQPASGLISDTQHLPAKIKLAHPPSEENPIVHRDWTSLQTQAFTPQPQLQNLPYQDSPHNLQNDASRPHYHSGPGPYATENTQGNMTNYISPPSQDINSFRSQPVSGALGEQYLPHSYSSRPTGYEDSLFATGTNLPVQPTELQQHMAFQRQQSQYLQDSHFLMPHPAYNSSIQPAALSKREHFESSPIVPSQNSLASQASRPGTDTRRTWSKAATSKAPPLPRLPRADLEKMEKALEEMSSAAEEIPIPDATARVVASCDSIVGNLFLSGDKSRFIFSQVVDEVSAITHLSLEISQLTEDPIVSQQGSRPMELRIKYKLEDGELTISRFYIGQTDAAFQSASILRSKIANARIAARVKSGETDTWKLFQENNVSQIEVIKPHQCVLCGSRFKNKEGIKYHLTKSNTTCNPNAVPKTPKPEKPHKKKKTSEKPTPKKTKKVVIMDHARHGKPQDVLLPDVEEDPSESDSSSEDSIYEWAEKVAFVHPGDQPKSTQSPPKKAQPRRQKVPVEEDVLKAIMKDAAVSAASCWVQTSTLLQSPETGAWGSVATGSCNGETGLFSGATSDEISNCSKEIILGLVNGNYGLFPGDKGLWFAFVAAWLQRHATSGIIPLSSLCSETLDQLVRDEKLSIVTAPIQQDDPMAPLRTIVALPTVDQSAAAVQKLKELVQFSYPSYYVPSKFAPANTTILTKLRQVTEVSKAHMTLYLETDDSEPTRKYRRTEYGKVSVKFRRESRTSDYSSDEDFIADDDYSNISDEASEDYDEDSDDLYEEGEASVEKYKQIDMAAYEKASTRERQAMRMKARRAAAKAFGSNNLAVIRGNYKFVGANRGRHKTSVTPTGTPTRNSARPYFGWKGPLTVEEKQRRADLATRRLQVWNQPLLATLQNPETGAWNQKPHRTKVYNRRYQLPEVLTFMQSGNGAWDIRPRGHGAKPVHSRPSRRADGNPHLPQYLHRLENGHRPVTEPTKNRLFLPANPSKVLLKNPQIYLDPEAEAHISKKRYRSRKRHATGSAERPDDDLEDGAELEYPNAKRRKLRKRKLKPLLFSDLDSGSDYVLSPSDTEGTRRITRNKNRGGNGVDPIQDLNFFSPRSPYDIKNDPNPGLDSLPASFGLEESRNGGFSQNHSTNGVAPVLGRLSLPDTLSLQDILSQAEKEPGSALDPVMESFDRVAIWELDPAQRLRDTNTYVSNNRWINHAIDSLESSFGTETIQLKWYGNTAFTVENIPYEELESLEISEDIEPAQVAEKPNSRKSKSKMTKNAVKESQKTFKRRLTSLATDLEGCYDDVEVAAKEFNVQVATIPVKFSGRTKGGTLSVEEENRFLLTVIVIRALAGGIPESIDWVLVGTLFPKYAITNLMKVWIRLSRKQKTIIEKITSDFQQAFITAYENDEVPPINYDELVKYDWAGLIDWAAKNLDLASTNLSIQLPDSRKALKVIYDVSEQESGERKARETYFTVAAPNYKRNEAVSAIPHTVSAITQPGPKTADDINIDEWTLVKSIVRATVFTPQSDYRLNVANAKLASLDNDLCSEIIKELIHDKVIVHRNKGRAVPERAYEPAENISVAFKKQSMQEKQFVEAVQFKSFLDSELASGKPFVRSDYMANEGTLMCVTSLQAHGRIRLQAVGVPMNKFGLTDGGYETRKLPKERFRFSMDIYPTDSYIYDSDNLILQDLDEVEIPRGGGNGEIPLWYGISDALIPDVWKKVLVGVAGVTAMRSGINVASLEEIFKPVLENWEIWRLMDWGVTVQLFERSHEGWEGWMVSEWWWALVGRMCEKHTVNDA